MAKKRKTELDIDTTTMPTVEPAAEAAPASAEEEIGLEPEKKPKAPRKPLNKKFLIIFGVALLALGLIAAVAATFIAKKETSAKVKKAVGRAEKEKQTKKTEPAKFDKLNNLVLAPFVLPHKVNGEDSFIRVVFALQLNDPEVIDEVNQNLPLIRNSILYAISLRKADDLLDAGKREELLKDLRYNIDRSLQTGRVEAVLLNELSVY